MRFPRERPGTDERDPADVGCRAEARRSQKSYVRGWRLRKLTGAAARLLNGHGDEDRERDRDKDGQGSMH